MDGRSGVLVTTDVPTMEFIKLLDGETASSKGGKGHIIIEQLDSTHVFIHKMYLKKIQDDFEEHLRKEVRRER